MQLMHYGVEVTTGHDVAILDMLASKSNRLLRVRVDILTGVCAVEAWAGGWQQFMCAESYTRDTLGAILAKQLKTAVACFR